MSAPKDRYWLWALTAAVLPAAVAAILGDAFWLLLAIVPAAGCIREWIKANRT